MALRLLLAVAALAPTVFVLGQNQTTWVVTSFITEQYLSWSTVQYDSVAVTPVKRSTSLSIVTLYTSEPPTSSDRTVTHWVTEQLTLPVSTYTSAFYTTLSAPLTVTSNGTSTIVNRVSAALATVTLSPAAACANSGSPTGSSGGAVLVPAKTVTEYTGDIQPIPGPSHHDPDDMAYGCDHLRHSQSIVPRAHPRRKHSHGHLYRDGVFLV